MSELYRDFIDRRADEIITDLGGNITPAPANTELYRDFLDRKFDDVIVAITNISTGGVLSGDTAPNNADGNNNDLYVQYDSSYNVVALYVKLNDIWRSISTTGSTHNYSTTEQVIGTWIDGSTLYEKTVSENIVTDSAQVIATIIGAKYKGIEGFILTPTGGIVPVPFNDGSSRYVPYTDNDDVLLAKTNASLGIGNTIVLTLQYTKN